MLTLTVAPRHDSAYELAPACSPQSHHAVGVEGMEIDKRIRSILNDLQARQGWLTVSSEGNQEGYRHIPLKTVRTIRVRFQKAVPLPPRRILIDDEDH